MVNGGYAASGSLAMKRANVGRTDDKEKGDRSTGTGMGI